jgi:hypothetical protein
MMGLLRSAAKLSGAGMELQRPAGEEGEAGEEVRHEGASGE